MAFLFLVLMVGLLHTGCGAPGLGAEGDQVGNGDGIGDAGESGIPEVKVEASGPQIAVVSSADCFFEDTYISSLQPSATFGSEPELRVGGAAKNRALIRPDLLALQEAVGAGELVSARLELTLKSNSGGWPDASALAIHLLRESFTEESGTWDCSVGTHPNSTGEPCDPMWSGGNFEPTATATLEVGDTTSGRVSFDVTSDVRQILEQGIASEMVGWLIRKLDDTTPAELVFGSRDDSGSAPKLVLNFETTAGPDTTPPQIAILYPVANLYYGQPDTMTTAFLDLASGVDLAPLR